MSFKKIKRIPAKFIYLGGALILLLVLVIISFIIQLSSASIKSTLKSGFSIDDCPSIVKANELKYDGKISSSSTTDLTYGSCSKLEGLEVGALAKKYYLPYQETEDGDMQSGYIEFYVGFNQTNKSQNLKISTAKIVIAEKWHDYCSSSTSCYSSSYTDSILKSSNMSFYSSTRNISIDSAQKFPKRYLFGMIKIKNPKLYVYVEYTIGSKSYTGIVEFDYDMYFIEGYTSTTK